MSTYFRLTIPSSFHRVVACSAALATGFALTLLFAMPLTVRAATYTVCPAPGDCDFETPDAAVNDVNIAAGDIINITTDTYVLGAAMQVVSPMVITINGNGSTLDANGSRALEVSGTSSVVTVNDVNIINGQDPGEGSGGAIIVTGGAQLILNSSTVANSFADLNGGGLSNSDSTVDIFDSAFIGNYAALSGGAIRTFGANAVTNLTRTTVDSNQSGVVGGGIATTNGGTINVFESAISNNAALTSSVIIDNFTVGSPSNNCLGSPYGQTFLAGAGAISGFSYRVVAAGGGIPTELNVPGRLRKDGPLGPLLATATAIIPAGTAQFSTLILEFILDQPVAMDPLATYAIETEVIGNYSVVFTPFPGSYADGQAYTCSTDPGGTDYDFQIMGGTPGPGGGAYSDGTIGLTNSTLSGNVGDGGFASATITGDNVVSVELSTVVNNSGNGLTAEAGNPGGVIAFGGSILAGNGGSDCFRGDQGAFTVSVDFNLIGDITGCESLVLQQNDQAGTTLSPIDPLLGVLQDNGGLTFTHALDPNSPAIDAAGNCGEATDQRGVARPQGDTCDVGSFELAVPVGPLQSLINAAAPGDTVIPPDGTYTEAITIGNGITLKATSSGSVVIDVSNLGVSAITATGDFALEGIRVTGGNSPANGGGIFAAVSDTDIILTDVQFDNNAAATNGGAIYQLNGTLNGTNLIFSNNNAGENGGAIYSSLNLMNLQNSVFSLNTASNDGGSIYNDGILTLGNSTVDSSVAASGGGLYNNANANATISASTFSSNNANGAGTVGGAIGGGGSISITNSTLSGNTTSLGGGDGGGIGLISGSARLNNVTLAFNSAGGLGGPFYAENGALISFSNTLLSGNTGGGTNCTTLTSLGYNLFQNTPCPTAATDTVAEPLINFLGAVGGPTETHSLQALSPAINAGHPVPSFGPFDAGSFDLLQTQGFTALDAGTLFLAGGVFNVGSAFVINPIDPGESFSAQFQFEIVPGTSGASDGFTFTITNDPTDLGQAGGFLGIGVFDQIEQIAVGIVEGVSVEFDTWVNGAGEGANDPGSFDHIGIDFNGSLSSEVLTIVGPHGTLSDGNIWTAWIDYDAAGTTLDVRASNNGIRPALATVSAGVDIESLTGPVAYVGFTGATGADGINGEQRIHSFSFDNSCESTDQRGQTRPNGSRCDIGSFEAAEIPLNLESVVLSNSNLDQDLTGGTSYPGVTNVPIIDIPIEKLTGDTFNSPESAPLGSFPLGSFPIGSFDLRSSPLGSFPIGSFPIGSFPIGSFPLGSFQLSSIPLLTEGGWSEVLDDIPALAGAPLQTVTLTQLLNISPLPDSVASISLRDLSIQGSPIGSFSLPGLSLGDTTVGTLDEWASNANPAAATICDALNNADSTFTECATDDTLLGLEVKGAPVSALSLSSLPLGSFPVDSAPIGSFPIGSFPIGSFPLGSFPIGSFPLGSFPIGSFPIGSFDIDAFPLGSFNLLASPIGSFPLGSFPLGSFPIGSFEIDGKSFCQFFDEQASADGSNTCSALGLDVSSSTLQDVLDALFASGSTNLGSTPLGSFPLGSFPIGSFPLGSFSIETINTPPFSLLTLADFDGCDGVVSADCTIITSPPYSGSTSLPEFALDYGSLAASPLGSFPIGSFDVSGLPMSSAGVDGTPLGSFEVNGTPLGSFPLGSFDLIGSPLGSFPIGSFPASVIADPDGICSAGACLTLADASRAGVINPAATLSNLSAEFDNITFGQVLDAMTLAILYGPGTLGDIEDTGNLTLGQLLISMMLKSDFPWETIPLDQLDSQEYSADNLVAYRVDIGLSGTELLPVTTTVTLADSFLYVKGSARLDVETVVVQPTEVINDPLIVNNGDGTQTLVFNLILGGFSDNLITFKAVPPLALGNYTATASVQIGTDTPVMADDDNSEMAVIADPFTDVSDPGSIPLNSFTPANVLTLGFINTPDDIDFFRVQPPAKGDRVAVFMSNPTGDNDLIMYGPLSSVEAPGRGTIAAPLDSVPYEDDGIDYQGNLTEEPNALEDVNLRSDPLASISTNRGSIDESVSSVAGNLDPFTIQVSGYNGAVSDQPYTLRVKVTSEVPNPQCTARSWPGSASSTVIAAGNWTALTNTVFLVNGARLAASDPGGEAAADAALTAINNLIGAPGIIDGVVVDVSGISAANDAYALWDSNPCDADAANAVVNIITAYLEEQRVISPRLTYVTIVGSDEVIPFARKADETSIANESTFAGEFADNALYGALVTRHFLSDDSYGDIDPIPWLDRYLNVPELAVGRLVESTDDIITAAENYIAFAGVLNPQTALSAGYDFIADSSEEIDDTFNEYGPLLGFVVEPALIDPPGITPKTDAWSKLDFISATDLDKQFPVELVSFNMHFDFDEALPSIGDATGNYTDNLINASDLDGAKIAGGIWYTVGCHSGTNVPDVSVMAGAPSLDWAQNFSHLGAVYLAQNAYGLGDTEAVALTEQLMANFTRNLNGSLTIGQAHAFAKQQYFADLGLYGEYDFKAMQAATLFGLPMYRFGNGNSVPQPTAPPLPVVIDPVSGLASATWSLAETSIGRTETSKGSLFSVDGDVQFVHFRPLQPIVRRDVTSPDGETAGGAFITQLTTEDIAVADIAFARPVIDLGENEPEIETDEVVFPTSFTNVAAFKAPPPGGGPFEPRDQLNVIVGQFTSPLDGASHGTERLFRDFDTQVFYRPAAAAQPAFASPLAASGDFVRPEFDNVQASVVGSTTAPQAAFSVDVTDNGTVLRVAVLYLQSVSGSPARGNWVLVDLVPGAGGNTWTGGGSVDLGSIPSGQIDYMVQAVDDNGNVANSTFKGLFYVAEVIAPPPDGENPDDPFTVQLTDPDNPSAVLNLNDWNRVTSIQVDIINDGEVTYVYSIDGSRPLLPLTAAGFVVSGDGVHIVQLFGSDGSVVTFVLLIDNTPPEVVIATPANGQYVVQGQSPPAAYVCRDSGSGTASCIGNVAAGDPVPTNSIGVQTFSVNATDNTGLTAAASNDYLVVQQLEIDAPVEPVVLDTNVSITVTATDLDGIDEHMTIEWGDGAISTSSTTVVRNGNMFTAEHVYATTGAYPVTVKLEYDGGAFVQTAVYEYVVVYDPNGGFATGGGWIDSPPGAYTPSDFSDQDVIGKAHFGFVSKYKKGQSVPEGSTSFRFAAADLKFEATSYDWMIISGARARYKGEGTVNGGAELYKFQVTALDADVSGAGITQDGFRIKIWRAGSGDGENVLYDNGRGADDATGNGGTTPLGGGSIKIHKAKK